MIKCTSELQTVWISVRQIIAMGAACLKGKKVKLELCHLIFALCCDTLLLLGMKM